jgi:hypothetical protein
MTRVQLGFRQAALWSTGLCLSFAGPAALLAQEAPVRARIVASAAQPAETADPAPQSLVLEHTKPVKGVTEVTVRLAPATPELRDAAQRLNQNRPSSVYVDFNAPEYTDVSLIGWTPSCLYGQYLFLCHDPLYFEDIGLERYGEETCHLAQPFVSGAKFFAAVPMVPYKWAVNVDAADHGEHFACDHHGQLRPGAAEGAYFPPFRAAPAAFTAGLVTGLFFMLP